MAIAQHTDAEIRRKAQSGEAMQSSTPEKQALYDKYQNEYKQLVTQKAQAGQSLQSPNAWKNEIYNQASLNLKPSDQAYYNSNNVMLRQENMGASQMEAMQRLLEQSASSQFQSQEALLSQARDAQILELQKALENAVAEGQISVRDAEAQFNAQKGQIEQQAYQDAERTGLMSQERGIQNSAQAIGLMQGDNARKNSLINQNVSERDMRINTIKDRLNSIKNSSALDIANANANYGYGVANAKGQIDSQMAQNMFQLNNEQLNMNRTQQFALDQAGMSQKQQREILALQQKYAQENAQMQQGFDLAKMDRQQVQQLEQMAKAFGYDLHKMDKQQQQQLAQMAQGFGYDSALSNQGFNQQSSLNSQGFYQDQMLNTQRSQLAMAEAQQTSSLRIAEETKAYDLAVQRELSKYKPGTKEYEILAGQLATERQSMINEIVTQAQVEASIMHNLGTPIAKPVKPTKGRFETKGHHEKELKEYESTMKKYEAYQRALNDPMSMFPRSADGFSGGSGGKW